jgi:predicted nuclease of restriction endonuclease-like RecB superfamily
VARNRNVTEQELHDSLFADLPGERKLVAPTHPISPAECALRVNLALVQAVLYRSTAVRIEAEGQARAVVRHAKLRGLICTVSSRGPAGAAALDVSGPFSLFRRTLLYGRALAELVPLLAWCTRFRLSSECELLGRSLIFVLRTGDPILPASEPAFYDSRLEARFARDFRRAAPDYDLVREPEAVEASGKLIFPDFAIQLRGDPSRRWLLEIVGFWTPEYLTRKLGQLKAAEIPNLILCLDEDRNCGERDLPANTPVVRFRRRIDPEAVLRAMNETEPMLSRAMSDR